MWLQHPLSRCCVVDFDCGINLAACSGHRHGANSRPGPALCWQHPGTYICPGTVMPSVVYSRRTTSFLYHAICDDREGVVETANFQSWGVEQPSCCDVNQWRAARLFEWLALSSSLTDLQICITWINSLAVPLSGPIM